MAIAIPAHVKRRRRSVLGTQKDAAAYLGVHPSTITRLEQCAIDGLLLAYLNTLGYNVTFHPRRKSSRSVS